MLFALIRLVLGVLLGNPPVRSATSYLGNSPTDRWACRPPLPPSLAPHVSSLLWKRHDLPFVKSTSSVKHWNLHLAVGNLLFPTACCVHRFCFCHHTLFLLRSSSDLIIPSTQQKRRDREPVRNLSAASAIIVRFASDSSAHFVTTTISPLMAR